VTLFLRFLPSLIILFIFLTDRLSKEWIQNRMRLGDSIPILSFFSLSYVKNTGIAFGVGQNRNDIFTLIAIVILILLVILLRYWEYTKTGNLKHKISLALIIGGAVGNIYDRIAYGNVIDFLDFYVGTTHWPSFNVADTSICLGAALLAFSSWNKK